MEDNWNGPEDPTNNESETTRKKRRGTNFLSQYLMLRREQQGEHIEEDDDEESDEKPKKFRRFFRGLFKNVVNPPEGHREAGPERSGLKNILLGTLSNPENNTGELSERDTYQRPQNTIATEQVRDTTEGSESLPVSAERATESVTNVTEPDPTKHSREDAEPATTLPAEQINTVRPYPEAAFIEHSDPINHTVFERQSAPPAEKEVIIERGTGMALPLVLVGAEYLARKKADRKLDAKYNERVTNLETRNKRDEFAQEQLESLVKQNKERLETLKRDRGFEAARVVERQPERPQVPRTEQRSPEQQPMPATTEKTGQPETYKIMEQVAKAAEQDIPVERVFERSHEVKDDQNVPVGAASVGSIMAEQIARQHTGSHSTSSTPGQDVSGLPVISDSVRAAMYKQAMRNGFWAAVIIIILGTIAYLLK